MSTLSSVSDSTYPLPVPALLPATPSAASPGNVQPVAAGQDGVELSPAGRLALGSLAPGSNDFGVNDDTSGSGPGQQLYSQQTYLQPGASEKQRQDAALDGDQSPNSLDPLQSQSGGSSSSASSEAGNPAVSNEIQQGGRVISLEKAGDITNGQMSALLAQIGIGYQQAEMGV